MASPQNPRLNAAGAFRPSADLAYQLAARRARMRPNPLMAGAMGAAPAGVGNFAAPAMPAATPTSLADYLAAVAPELNTRQTARFQGQQRRVMR